MRHRWHQGVEQITIDAYCALVECADTLKPSIIRVPMLMA
jgi:hypothetical protein